MYSVCYIPITMYVLQTLLFVCIQVLRWNSSGRLFQTCTKRRSHRFMQN